VIYFANIHRDHWVTACASGDVAQPGARIVRRNAHEEAPRRNVLQGASVFQMSY